MSARAAEQPGPLRHLTTDLDELGVQGRLRMRPPARTPEDRASRLVLCSNDYLGYQSRDLLRPYAEKAARDTPVGSGASRLVSGEHAAHVGLEKVLATWLGSEETLVFSSGYAANVGAIAALAGEGDLVVSDELNHASIIDGCRLARADAVVVPHLDLEAVRRALAQSRARRRWVVTETYFSMDGDSPDLPALRRTCNELDAALIVDEAHAIGVFGPQGRGLAAESGVAPDVTIGTLGKALGAQGAFVAGSAELCHWLWNRARSFGFSTGISPLLCAIATEAVSLACRDDDGRARLTRVSAALREGLGALGIAVKSRTGPILPFVVGTESLALSWGRRLADLGVDVQPIRPPTVPPGTSRLRIAASAALSTADVDRALNAFARVRRETSSNMADIDPG
jgi:8-amino-7-oxononanoate synthase